MLVFLKTLLSIKINWLSIFLALITSSTVTLQKRYQRPDDPCYDEEGNPRQCRPGFENVALKKKVIVSETCGVPRSEPYCRLTLANGHIARSCDVCERTGPHSHPASYLTDINDTRNLTFWQSKVFRSSNIEERQRNVTLTISFGKKYELSYVYLQFYSPRPKAMIIYKSMNGGRSWVPYQYYARSCRETFNMPNQEYANRTNLALCLENSSSVRPISSGRVVFSPSRGRQSDIDASFLLQDWITATDIKIVLSDVNDIRSEFAIPRRRSVESSNPGVRRRQTSPQKVSSSARKPGIRDRKGSGGSTAPASVHTGERRSSTETTDMIRNPSTFSQTSSAYYAINDISIGGRCKCNGHASRCLLKNGKLICDCKHNTDGVNCERCRAFHYDRPWKRATRENANACVACNCNLHAKRCRFNAELFSKSGGTSGGVCQKCRHHTTGRFCHYCKQGYYRNNKTKSIAHRKVCKPCGCHPVGSAAKICNRRTGQCPCKEGVTGKKCNRCAKGYKQTRSRIVPCLRIPPVKVPKAESCTACKKPQGVHLSVNKLCKVDFVVEMKVVSHTPSAKWARVTLDILRVFKRGNVKLRRGPVDVRIRKRHLACLCPRLKKNRKYLLLGKSDSTGEPSISIDKNSIVIRWKSKYKRKLVTLLRRAHSKEDC